MKNNRLFPLWHYSGAAEEPWCPPAHRELAAGLAFRRARRAGRWRRFLGAWLSPGPLFAPALDRAARPRGPAARLGELPIELVVGICDRDGRCRRPLPGLRAGHRRAWMRFYLAGDPGGYPALRVHAGPGGYYLDGDDPRAVIILEVLRAKGAAAVRVEPAAAAPAGDEAQVPDLCVQEVACCA
jgi:hypothetical protein